jgi:hypothetical protein
MKKEIVESGTILIDDGFECIFSKKNVAGMLLFINAHKKVKERQLTEVVSNYYQSVDVAGTLVNAGLVRTWSEKIGHTTQWYEITDLGADVASCLTEANNLMSANFEKKTVHRVSAKEKSKRDIDMKYVISRMPKVGYIDSEGYTVLPKEYDDDDDDYADV